MTSLDDLDAALARATSRPVFLFKHSETCGMSLYAHEEVREAIRHVAWAHDVYVISVQRSRALSNEVAARLSVRHASPQMLLVQDGTVRWQATHSAITAPALRAVAERHAAVLAEA